MLYPFDCCHNIEAFTMGLRQLRMSNSPWSRRSGGGEIGLCCNSKSQDVDPNDVRASDVLKEETADGR